VDRSDPGLFNPNIASWARPDRRFTHGQIHQLLGTICQSNA
jgi:hypothetical protein